MRFNRKNLPKKPVELDEFVRQRGLRPLGVAEHKGRKIYLAETDLEMDRPIEYPWGYYQTAWFVTSPASDEKFDGGSWVEFESMHDTEQNWTPETKRQARIQTTVQHAAKWIDSNIETGRYG